MVENRSDPRRAACEELARLLATPEGLRLARLLQLIKPVARPSGAAPAPSGKTDVGERRLGDAPIPIGIWTPQEVDGQLVFARPDPPVMGDPWDPREILTPKTSLLPLRVCLLGESAAAGWFYAPHLTPAGLLEDQLRVLKGPGIYEVINLTRIDLSAHELADLALAALQLKPDVFVIFAGNNWPVHYGSFPDHTPLLSQEAALAFREDGIRGLMRSAELATRRMGEAVLARIGQLADAAGIPVVLVIPEVNLADWERDRPVTWLPGDGTARWHVIHGQAMRSMGTGDYQAAAAAARTMIELDGGTCATSHRVLANALAALGQLAEARESCLAEVDCRAWDNLPNVPGATSAVRDVLRRGAHEHGFSCVDLPAVFREYGAPLAGRRLFLDYCHLTLEGMKVAMAAVAAELLSLSDAGPDSDPDWKSLVARLPDPQVPVQVDAHAKFMSGLYHAHWNTRSGEAQYWFEQALRAWSGVQDTMLAYVATRAAPAGSLLFSVEQQRLFHSERRLEHRIWNVPNLDAAAIEVICALLDRSASPARPRVAPLLMRHHGATDAEVNLLDPMYHWTLQDTHGSSSSFGNDRYLYYRSLWPASHFCLVAEGAEDITLELTGRLPVVAAPRRGEVGISLNGRRLGTVRLSDRWTKGSMTLERQHVRPGINRVTLEWPLPPPEGDAAIRENASRLEQAIPTELHPVFGELFRLVASSGHTKPAPGAEPALR